MIQNSNDSKAVPYQKLLITIDLFNQILLISPNLVNQIKFYASLV